VASSEDDEVTFKRQNYLVIQKKIPLLKSRSIVKVASSEDDQVTFKRQSDLVIQKKKTLL